jgi:hypothetical protein
MAILVQSQGIIISFWGLSAKVAMGLDHERSGASCLVDCKEILLGRGLGLELSWGDFFVGFWFL